MHLVTGSGDKDHDSEGPTSSSALHALFRASSTQSDPCSSSVTTAIMITTSNSACEGERDTVREDIISTHLRKKEDDPGHIKP